MTDDETSQAAFSEAEIADAEKRIKLAPDFHLMMLVETAIRGAEWPITVAASGLVLTGYLISGEKHYRLIADELKKRADDGVEVARVFEEFAEMSAATSAPSDDGQAPMLGFLHLRDATAFVGGERVNMATWRGRLSEVSGWSLGTI